MYLKQYIKETLVEIPGGKITLRDDRLKETWTEEVSPFLLSKYLITQEFYQEVTQTNPSSFKGLNNPVEWVSWFDCIQFCNLLSQKLNLEVCYLISGEGEKVEFSALANGFRLPTEAEWEFACKAGENTIRYGEIDSIAWYKANSNGKTHPVGLKQPNKFGLYDMLGNVWEWCSDLYDETVYGTYRILRGGGWNDEERGCLATNRRRSHPVAFKIDDLGFRIAKNIN